MASFFPLILVCLLFALLLFILYRKMLPGVSYSVLREAKNNADVLASFPLLMLSVDKSGLILAVHSLPPDFTGEINSDCSGRNWCEFVHRNYHAGFLKALENTSLSGDSHTFQYEARNGSALLRYEGHITAISKDKLLICIKDITDNRIAQEKLDLVNTSESITTFVLDIDLMMLTFDREDFLSKLSGRNINRKMSVKDVLSLFPVEQGQNLLNALEGFLSGEEGIPPVSLKFNDTGNWIIVKGLVVSGNSAGKPTTIVATLRDVTKSVAAENELLSLNLMLKNLLDRIPIGLYWKDRSLKYSGASRVFLDDSGVSSEEYLDDNLWITEESRQIEGLVMETGKPVLNKLENVCLSGSKDKIVNISRVPLKSSDDVIVGLMVTYTDVTEITKFRDQLEQRKKFLSGLVDNLPSGFFAKDPSAGMTYRIWNREMEEIFGYTASEAVELKDWNLFGTTAAAQLKSDDDALLADPESGKTAKIYKLQGRNGIKTVSIGRVLLYDDLLDSTLVAGVVDDITRENELEDQLRQSQKMEAIGRLAGGVAHDFNNLLQVIMGAAEIGLNGTGTTGKSFDQILQATEKAMFLTRQLLSFSRDESFRKSVFAVDHRVGEFVRMVHRIIGTGAKLEFHSGAHDAMINGDPFQIEQVLMNLLVNAKDAIPEGRAGVINVETSTSMVSLYAGSDPVECAVISVSDNGDGIPENIRSRIFEPFFTTKSSDKGTGLGLASSYGIVAKHNGVLLVESTVDEGSRFDACIPTFKGNIERVDETNSDQVAERPFSPLTILLAEDEEMVRDISKTILESAGHEIIEAENGQVAVELFRENCDQIDMLIFDAMMPVMNGSEAFSRIQKVAPDIPVLFCTGYSRDKLVKSFSEEGITDVLQKPYSAVDLLNAVENLSRKK